MEYAVTLGAASGGSGNYGGSFLSNWRGPALDDPLTLGVLGVVAVLSLLIYSLR